MHRISELLVNGSRVPVDLPSEKPLLYVLREDLGLTGAKIGCAEGECGACTVLVDGEPTRACVTTAGSVSGKKILTVEGLEQNGTLHPLQQAFLDVDALQCGYCTPGMIMSGIGLLTARPDPSEDEIVAAMQGNICRCGAYRRIIQAIQKCAAARHEAVLVGRIG